MKKQSLKSDEKLIPPSEKIVLTEIEAAEYVGMSRSFLRHGRIDGNRENRTPAPKFIKIGRSIRYMRQDLDDYLAQFPRLNHLYEGANNDTRR